MKIKIKNLKNSSVVFFSLIIFSIVLFSFNGINEAEAASYQEYVEGTDFRGHDYKLRVTVVTDKDVVQVGDTITYTATVHNQSPPNANPIELHVKYERGTANGKGNYSIVGFYSNFGFDADSQYQGVGIPLGCSDYSLMSEWRCTIGVMKPSTSSSWTIVQTIDGGQSGTNFRV